MNRIALFCLLFIPLFSFNAASKFYPLHKTLPDTRDYSRVGNSSYILPKIVKPYHYNLTISQLSFKNRTFKGTVDISGIVLNSTTTISLNVNNNSINTSSMVVTVSSDRKTVSVINITVAELQEIVTFHLNDSLVLGENVSIIIWYQAKLRDDMSGFYFSSYNITSENTSGITVTEHYMAVTQFEATGARKAFPCFDEPAYRSNFTINIFRHPNLTSISNMPLKNSIYEPKNNQVIDMFYTSPSMPTYLVAFIVSDLANITEDKNISLFARHNVVQEGSYILSKSPNILSCIGGFVNVSFTLPKIDIVAVPDFEAGAMENWGLTTYREKYVLYNPLLNTQLDKFRVLSVVAHEFGHQWFGDLVTPLWWNYTWLNEAFATYFEYTVPNKVEPYWINTLGEEIFVMMAVQEALAMDTNTPRPMTSQVNMPSEIENIFDYVIYEKGGSILRMAENFLTTEVWRAGLNKYLVSNSYATGTPDKLFNALQDSANAARINVNVSETLHHWTDQGGYPLITVHSIFNSYFNTTTFNITQTAYDVNSSKLAWNVPLHYCHEGRPYPLLHWLLPSSPNTQELIINTTGLVIFNCKQLGFFRVNYDVDMWKRITVQLNKNHSIIGAINRAQLIDDAFHLAQTAHISYATAFSLLSYITREKSVVVWNAFFVNMRYLINQFSSTATEDNLKQYSRSIVAAPLRSLIENINNTLSTFNGSLLAQQMSQFACEVGLPQCQRMAIDIFQSWKSNKTNFWIVPEFKQTVICFGLKNNSSLSSFLDVFTLYLDSNNAAEKLTILAGLGCLSNDDVINVYLNLVCDVNSNYIRLQDRWLALRSLSRWQPSVMPTLKYIVNNYNITKDAIGPRISAVFVAIGKTLSQPSHVAEVKMMLNDKQNMDPILRDALNNTVLSGVLKRLAWTSTPQADSLKSYIASQTSAASSYLFSPILLISTLILYIILFNC